MKLGFFGWCFVLLDGALQAFGMSHRIDWLVLMAAFGPVLLVPLSSRDR